MNMEVIILISGFIGTIVLSVMGYFLKATMTDLKDVKQTAYETKSKLAVIESEYTLKHTHLTEKFDELHDAVKDLTKEIKSLTQELHKKKPD